MFWIRNLSLQRSNQLSHNRRNGCAFLLVQRFINSPHNFVCVPHIGGRLSMWKFPHTVKRCVCFTLLPLYLHFRMPLVIRNNRIQMLFKTCMKFITSTLISIIAIINGSHAHPSSSTNAAPTHFHVNVNETHFIRNESTFGIVNFGFLTDFFLMKFPTFLFKWFVKHLTLLFKHLKFFSQSSNKFQVDFFLTFFPFATVLCESKWKSFFISRPSRPENAIKLFRFDCSGSVVHSHFHRTLTPFLCCHLLIS